MATTDQREVASPSRLDRLFWFVLLWALGVAVTGVIAWLIRLMILP